MLIDDWTAHARTLETQFWAKSDSSLPGGKFYLTPGRREQILFSPSQSSPKIDAPFATFLSRIGFRWQGYCNFSHGLCWRRVILGVISGMAPAPVNDMSVADLR